MAPRHWFTTQNFRVGTLQAARDDSVPATNFGSRIKTESGGTSKGEFFCEANGFFSPIAVAPVRCRHGWHELTHKRVLRKHQRAQGFQSCLVKKKVRLCGHINRDY